MRQKDLEKLSAAPEDDIELVSEYFNNTCNCYSYAVQDYMAGCLSDQNNDDFSYLPRPGQTKGNTYLDLIGNNVKGMRRAICEDGLLFAGEKYPQKIPDGHYVICCFLEPKEYHFIRQNRDGSWTSKNGRNGVTNLNDFGEPITNPEDFYHNDPKHKFVGYFFVPEGGIKVGIRAYEQNRLEELKKPKNPQEKKEKEILEKLVAFSQDSHPLISRIRELKKKKGVNAFLEISNFWEKYLRDFTQISNFCKNMGYSRKAALKRTFTSPKHKNGKEYFSR